MHTSRLGTLFLLLLCSLAVQPVFHLALDVGVVALELVVRTVFFCDHELERNYTYIEGEVENRLDGKAKTKSSEVKTYEVLEIYGEQVERLIEKDDKPLSAKDAAKEEEKIQKIIDKRKNESDSQLEKRLKEEEKDRREASKFVAEIAHAYHFRLA